MCVDVGQRKSETGEHLLTEDVVSKLWVMSVMTSATCASAATCWVTIAKATSWMVQAAQE